MAIKPRISKDIYGAALSGDGYSSITKRKSGTNGAYANGIEALAQINGNGLSGANAQAPLLKTSDISSQYNGNVVKPIYNSRIELGGGATGGTTREGVVRGNLGVTKMPTINPTKSTGIGKTASIQAKYGDILAAMKQPSVKNIAVNSASAPQQTQAAAPVPTETAAKTKSAAETPATYEEYLEQQRELLDQRKAEADRQAEAAKERAAVDAQASYAQNMATYGTNAENMAQMGLQGGGYGDYVNAQAYAQKRADMQQANVTEQAAKAQNTATYEDALAALNKSELEYKEKQQEKEESKQDKQSSIYASLWEGATNPNSGYTADGIAAIGREYGLSETQIAELQSIVAQTQAKSETDRQAANYSELVSQIAGATSKDLLDTALNNKDITQEQYNSLLKTYQEQNYNSFTSDITNGITDTASIDRAFNNGDITQEQYDSLKTKWNNEIDTSDKFFYGFDYATAKQAYNTVIGNSWCTDAVKNELRSSFYKAYESDIAKESVAASGFNSDKADGKIININSSTYSVKSWGDYNGSGKGDEQDQLVNAYVQAAKDGKIAVGQVCKFNYGACWSDEGYYIYIGDGMFVHYKETPGNMQDNKSKYYVPDGFKWSGNGSIKKK